MVRLSHRHFIEEHTLAFCHCPAWLFIQFQVIFNSLKQSLAERRDYSQFKLSFQNKAFLLAFDQTWYRAWQWYPRVTSFSTLPVSLCHLNSSLLLSCRPTLSVQTASVSCHLHLVPQLILLLIIYFQF